MNNLRIWSEVSKPPAIALKTITGGRLSGMTDIKPQWRLEVMTELFGPCGVGWKYEIVSLWPVHLESGEATAFAQINLYFKDEGKWSDPVPGIGGSMLVAKEKNGLHVSDEAYKMALTDALSVAMKALGVAAEVYAGNWDGTKYKEVPKKFRFKPGQKDELIKQVKYCLDNGDGHGVQEILSEFSGPEERVAVWALFNSRERDSIKKLTADL